MNDGEKIRKVYLDDLPRGGKFIKDNAINWEGSIGEEVKFEYDGITGKIKIVGYNKDKHFLDVIYNNKYFKLYTCRLINCSLAYMLKLRNFDYTYNVGEIVHTQIGKIEILEQLRNGKDNRRAYKYKCLECGNIDCIDERNLIYGNQNCNVCSRKKVLKGINDIATTHPHLVKYFVDIEDTYTHSSGMGGKVLVKCPDCKQKVDMIIRDLCYRDFSCPHCSDGISYPNKFMYGLFKNLNADFETEKTFKWSKNINHENKTLSGNKRYDFYFKYNNEDYICEANGIQHYKESFQGCGGRTLKEEQKNDKLKKQLAINNGIKEENYIVIDARFSEIEWIKNNILKSRLSEIFDLSKVDWRKVEEFALSNRVKEICDLKRNNPNITVSEIAKIVKLETPTVRKYLKQGVKLEWCEYKPDESSRKKIVCIDKENRKVEFNSLSDCVKKSVEYFGVQFTSGLISQVCNGTRNHHKGFMFQYV